MGILKLPKYMELPGGVQPITRCRRGDVAEFVIVTNFKEQVERASQFLDQIASKVEGDEASYLITGMYKGFRLTIANCGIGVGQTSNILEELINLGGRVFIQLGATGALQRDISVGEIIVPTGSVRDEGLSDYYAPKQYPATADYRIGNSPRSNRRRGWGSGRTRASSGRRRAVTRRSGWRSSSGDIMT